jgi:hypothetical protein
MNGQRELPPPPTVRDSVSDAINAGHDLLLNRLELALLDARAFATMIATRALLIVVGGVFALGALVAADLAIVHALHTQISLPSAFVICAAINLVIAAALIAAGILHGRGH